MIDLQEFPYHTNIRMSGWREKWDWCEATFGECANSTKMMDNHPNPDGSWCMWKGHFWFREEKHLSWYLLRWD